MHLVWLRIRTEMIFWYGFKFFKSFTHLSGKSDRPQLRQGSGTFSLGTSTLVAFGLDFCFPKRWICPIDGSSFCVSCNVFFTRFFSCILKKKKFFFSVLTLQKKLMYDISYLQMSRQSIGNHMLRFHMNVRQV